MTLTLLGLILVGALLWTTRGLLRARRQRVGGLSGRMSLDVGVLARDIAADTLDPRRVESELVLLAKALRVDAGKLRSDDVVVEWLGSTSFAGGFPFACANRDQVTQSRAQ